MHFALSVTNATGSVPCKARTALLSYQLLRACGGILARSGLRTGLACGEGGDSRLLRADPKFCPATSQAIHALSNAVNPGCSEFDCGKGGVFTAPDLGTCQGAAAALDNVVHNLQRNRSEGVNHHFDNCLAPTTQTSTATSTATTFPFQVDFRCSPQEIFIGVPSATCAAHARTLNRMVVQCDGRPGNFACSGQELRYGSVHQCTADAHVINRIVQDIAKRPIGSKAHVFTCPKPTGNATLRMVHHGQGSCNASMALLNSAVRLFLAGKYSRCSEGNGYTTATTSVSSTPTSTGSATATTSVTTTATSTPTTTRAHCNGLFDRSECRQLQAADCARNFSQAGFSILNRCPVLCNSCTSSTTTTTHVMCNGIPDPTDCQSLYRNRCDQVAFGVVVNDFCPGMCKTCTTTTTTRTISSAYNSTVVFELSNAPAGMIALGVDLNMFHLKMTAVLAGDPLKLTENEHYRVESVDEYGDGIIAVRVWFVSEEVQDMVAFLALAEKFVVPVGNYKYTASLRKLTTTTSTSVSSTTSTGSPFETCPLVKDTAELLATNPQSCRGIALQLDKVARLCYQKAPRIKCASGAGSGLLNTSTAAKQGSRDFDFGPSDTDFSLLLAGDATRCQNVADALNAALQLLDDGSSASIPPPHLICTSGFLGVAVGCSDATDAILLSLRRAPTIQPTCQYRVEDYETTVVFHFARTLAYQGVMPNLDYGGFVTKLETELIAFLETDSSQVHVELFNRTTGSVAVRITPGFFSNAKSAQSLVDTLEAHVNDPAKPFTMTYLGVWLSTSTVIVEPSNTAASSSAESSLIPLLVIPVAVLSICFVMVCWMQCSRSRAARMSTRKIRARQTARKDLVVALVESDAKRRAEVERHAASSAASPVLDEMVVPLSEIMLTKHVKESAFKNSTKLTEQDAGSPWLNDVTRQKHDESWMSGEYGWGSYQPTSPGRGGSVTLPYGPRPQSAFADVATSPVQPQQPGTTTFDMAPTDTRHIGASEYGTDSEDDSTLQGGGAAAFSVSPGTAAMQQFQPQEFRSSLFEEDALFSKNAPVVGLPRSVSASSWKEGDGIGGEVADASGQSYTSQPQAPMFSDADFPSVAQHAYGREQHLDRNAVPVPGTINYGMPLPGLTAVAEFPGPDVTEQSRPNSSMVSYAGEDGDWIQVLGDAIAPQPVGGTGGDSQELQQSSTASPSALDESMAAFAQTSSFGAPPAATSGVGHQSALDVDNSNNDVAVAFNATETSSSSAAGGIDSAMARDPTEAGVPSVRQRKNALSMAEEGSEDDEDFGGAQTGDFADPAFIEGAGSYGSYGGAIEPGLASNSAVAQCMECLAEDSVGRPDDSGNFYCSSCWEQFAVSADAGLGSSGAQNDPADLFVNMFNQGNAGGEDPNADDVGGVVDGYAFEDGSILVNDNDNDVSYHF